MKTLIMIETDIDMSVEDQEELVSDISDGIYSENSRDILDFQVTVIIDHEA